MARKRSRWIVAAIIAAGAVWAAWYMSRPQPLPVALHEVGRGTVEDTVANTRAGTVNACRRARIAPSTSGQVDELPISEGAHVRRGQVLLRLWSKDLQAQLKLQQSEADAARARDEEACVRADVAQREAQRLQRLRERGVASEDSVDKAVGAALAQAAACRAARAATEVAAARVAVARVELERTVLSAPFDGVVAELNAELGEVVTPSPLGVATPPAVDLIDDRCLYVTAPIDEIDAPAIRAGMFARVSLDAFAQREFAGEVRRIAPYVLDVERQARTVEIEVNFRETGLSELLLPGYSADVEVVLERRDAVLRIPSEALLPGERVLVYDAATGVLEERAVTLGLANWRWTQIVSGLDEHEHIVTSVNREGIAAGAAVIPEQGR